ncbi:MAG: hypothetical protein U0R49_11710 [Fimbriimonadales bacterium]
MIIDPDNPQPGANIVVTVRFDKPPIAANQTVQITGGPAGAFSSLPSSVTLLIGRTELHFGATIGESAQGQVWVTATCNGGTATGTANIAAE